MSNNYNNSLCSQSSSSSSSSANFDSLRYSMRLEDVFDYSNPGLIYRFNPPYRRRGTTFRLGMKFDDLYLSAIPSRFSPNINWYTTDCEYDSGVFLPKISELLEQRVEIPIFECCRSKIPSFDDYLVQMAFREEYNFVEQEEGTYGFHNLDDLIIQDCPFLLTMYLPRNDRALTRSLLNDQSISPFTCRHIYPLPIERNVVPTSLGLGLMAGTYSAYQLATSRNSPPDIQRILARWSIELVQLVTNFSISNLILTFLKVLNEWFDISKVTESTLGLFKKVYSYLESLCPTQHLIGPNVVATSLITNLQSLATMKGSAIAIASAISSVIIVFATLIVGKDLTSIFSFKFENLANTFANMTKLRNGISATKDMLLQFNSFLYETIFDLLGIECESHLVTLLRSSSVIESENCKRIEVFDYAKFLINPENLIAVQSNSAQRKRLEFTYEVLTEIQLKIAEQITQIPQTMIKYIENTVVELQKVRKSVSKAAKGQTSRFTPMWINFVGESHTGKSNFTTIFTKVLISMLKKSEQQLGINFEIPCDDNVEHHVNFCDKYETNYTGQYMTIIDDFAQDAPGSLETNSGLKMINWVSSIPYYTNQAQLDNKGIPFTSKLIISTSNDLSLSGRKEIISNEALVNRMTMCFKFTRDETKTKHQWFPCGITIDHYDFKNRRNLESNITPERLIQLCFTKYVEWFKKENMIADLRKVEESMIDNIMKDIPILQAVASTSSQSENSEVPTSQALNSDRGVDTSSLTGELEALSSLQQTQNSNTTVVATSRMWCIFGLNPGYKTISQATGVNYLGYDCGCEFHTKLNNEYLNYVIYTDIVDMDIERFNEHTRTSIGKIDCLRESLKNSWQKVQTLANSYLNNTCFKLVTGAIALATTSTILWNYLSEDESDEGAVAIPTAKYTIGVRRAKAKKVVIATSGIDAIEAMFNDKYCKNAADIAKEVIIKKGLICKLISKQQINTGLRIAGTALLSNHHFFNMIEENSKFSILYNDLQGAQHRIEQVFTKDRMRRIPNTDLAVYNCDYSMPGAKNIIKHFPESEVMPQYQKSIVITADPIPIVHTNVIAKPTLVKAKYVVGSETYSTLDNYETNCPVSFGMSGSVLFSLSNGQKHKIIGIQTCKNHDGLDDYGYYKPVTQEQLLQALNELRVEGIYSNIDKAVVSTSLKIDNRVPPNLAGNSLTYLGTLPKTKQIKQQNVSKYIESMVHKVELRTQEPSVLRDNDERMNEDLIGKPIIFRAIEGYDHPIGSIDTKLLDKAADQLTIEYDNILNINGITRRILTNFEMVNGIPGVILSIDMKTSPGYPFVLERKQTTLGGKYEWFDIIEAPEGYGKAYQMKSSLLCGLEQAEVDILEGRNPIFLGYTCLKDETRPLDKIAKGKTRAFICLPLHYNLLIRKYFGAFTSALKMKAGIVSSCVGVDPAKDWKRIYHKLMAKNCLWEDFDYANWDQHLHPELIMKVGDVVNRWYNDGNKNATVRKTLLYTLVHTFIIVKDRLFLKSQGQCSGCAITAELNCVVHDLLMIYVWLKYHKDNDAESDLSSMRDIVALCVYGDDIILACDPDYGLPFNGNVIAPYMEELGMNITPGDKISTTFDLKDPENIFFLKRNFVRDGERILAPLRSDIVENIIQWIHKSDDNLVATRVNCETALQESYMHRKPYFNKLLNEINDRIKAVNYVMPGLDMKPVIVDYDVLDRKYIGGHFICAGLSDRLAGME